MGDIDEHFRAVGRMVLITRQLEHTTYDVARGLGVRHPEFCGATDALREAKRQAHAGLPPWSNDLSRETLRSFLSDARRVFEARNRLVHWQELSRYAADGTLVPILRSKRRPDQEMSPSPEQLQTDIQLALEASRAGKAVFLKLLLTMRPGVYHWYPPVGPPGEEWIPLIYAHGDTWPPRPTNHEILEWQSKLEASLPAEWLAWVHERYGHQPKKGK